MALILPGNVASATADAGYNVANSCRFNDGDSASMSRTLGTPTNNLKWTFSTWMKRSAVDVNIKIFSSWVDGDNFGMISINAAGVLDVASYIDGFEMRYITNRVFRDPSAWYHICVSHDATLASPLTKIYINGTQETSFSTSNASTQNEESHINKSGVLHSVGQNGNNQSYVDGYLAETVFIDGTANAVTDFGEFDEDSPTIWKPIDVSGLTFGNNGFYLDYEASDNLGNDANGGTDWAEANLAATDQATDTPTNNFCTLNPLFGTTGRTFSEGNTHYVYDDNWHKATTSTIAVTAGKWYYEFRNETDTPIEVAVCNGTIANNGIWGTSTVRDAGTYSLRQSNDAITWHTSTDTGNLLQNGSNIRTDLSQLGEDEIGMVAFDCATGKIWTGTNNTWDNSGDPAGDSNPSTTWSTNFTAGELTWFAFGSEGNADLKVNFGNPSWAISSSQADENGYGNFEYSVPSGFLALCTKNLGSDGG